MEKTRVPKCKKYWYILLTYEGVEVNRKYELLNCFDNGRFHNGNYFHTEEEAEACARKLRAVLKGAEVIEMPSEEEWKQIADSLNNGFEDSQSSGIRETYNYFKSKIVK